LLPLARHDFDHYKNNFNESDAVYFSVVKYYGVNCIEPQEANAYHFNFVLILNPLSIKPRFLKDFL